MTAININKQWEVCRCRVPISRPNLQQLIKLDTEARYYASRADNPFKHRHQSQMHRPSTKHKSRISTDPRIKSRLRDFEFLDKIHQRVKRHKTTQIFSPGRLANYPIAHGSFDIDQDDPIDLEPRFFLPGLVEDMESALKTQPLAWSDTIESFPPIEQHHTTQGSDPWLVRLSALRATGDAYTLEHQFFCTSSEIKKWSDDWYFPGNYRPGGDARWTEPDGRFCCHTFRSRHFLRRMVLDDKGSQVPDPDLPHMVGTVCDGARPRGGAGLLRSELLMAITLIKTRVRKMDLYLDHAVFPALVISFHDRFSARILQAHLYNGKLVIRSSRMINLHTPVVTPDMKLLLRWMNSTPVGDTRQSTSDSFSIQDDDGALSISCHNHKESATRSKVSAR